MIVYLLRCRVSGKGYVGQTIYSLEHRWHVHCSDARTRSRWPLHCAIRKYGEEAFERVVLEITDNLIDLNRLEIEQIQKQGTLAPGGYNLTLGGNRPPSTKGRKLSPETKARISQAKMGKKHAPMSLDARKHMARFGPKRRIHFPTEATRQKMSLAQYARWEKFRASRPAGLVN